jgi:hypothetical protein
MAKKSLKAITEIDQRLDNWLKDSFVDLTEDIKPPESVIEIISGIQQRLMTRSNFSAITGKQKSKKTIFTSLLLAAASSGSTIKSKLVGKTDGLTLYFDTEQAKYDTQKVGQLILGNGGNLGNIRVYCLRPFKPSERVEIIDQALKNYPCSYVVIDGVADLVTSINDEDQASDITNKLMNWTAKYNCHITVVIHQNKDNNYATGHLGSSVLKKCETVISVTKDPDFHSKSKVECQLIRGASHFEDFEIEITNNEVDMYDIQPTSAAQRLTYEQKLRKDVPF